MVPNFFNEDWRIWQLVSPEEGLMATFHFLVWLAIIVHFAVLFGSDRYAAAWLG